MKAKGVCDRFFAILCRSTTTARNTAYLERLLEAQSEAREAAAALIAGAGIDAATLHSAAHYADRHSVAMHSLAVDLKMRSEQLAKVAQQKREIVRGDDVNDPLGLGRGRESDG